MKSFIKNILANIIAILIIGALIFVSLFAILISSIISEKEPYKVKDNSVLILNFQDGIIESESEKPFSIFNLDSDPPIKYHDIVLAIRKAKNDDKIKGISIETDIMLSGQTHLDDIRNELAQFKKSGKWIYTYGNTVNQPAYYLGSVADQYFLNPVGSIDLKGISAEIVFLKDFIEKYGIEVEVIRHGKFKAAIEPYILNKISPENREQIQQLISDVWRNISAKISDSRNISANQFNKITDSLYGIISELAIQHKLADKLTQKSQYEEFLKTKLGLSKNKKLNKVSISNYIKSIDENLSGDEIAILYASGTIWDGKGFDGIYADNYRSHIRKLADNESVKAVVLRVNSPGGSANASDEILFELQELQKKKPLVISFGDYAASGGYYISMAGNKIYSEPNTITGSIGVFGLMYNAKTLANRNGIRSDIIATNLNSHSYSLLAGVNPNSLPILNRTIEKIYKRFVEIVQNNRKKTFEEIDAIGEGRVWSGTKAKEIGLVDEIGGLNDAITYAAKISKVNKYHTKNYPEEMDEFEKLIKFLNKKEDIYTQLISNKIGNKNYQDIKKFIELLEKKPNNIMMYTPYQINID